MAGPELTLPAAPPRDSEFGHDALVVCDNLVRIYRSESVEVQALQGLDLLVHQGEMIAMVGATTWWTCRAPSGCATGAMSWTCR